MQPCGVCCALRLLGAFPTPAFGTCLLSPVPLSEPTGTWHTSKNTPVPRREATHPTNPPPMHISRAPLSRVLKRLALGAGVLAGLRAHGPGVGAAGQVHGGGADVDEHLPGRASQAASQGAGM